MVKALICAMYCQKASVCKHAVIQSQICLWRSALNQTASRCGKVGQKKRHRKKLFYDDGEQLCIRVGILPKTPIGKVQLHSTKWSLYIVYTVFNNTIKKALSENYISFHLSMCSTSGH